MSNTKILSVLAFFFFISGIANAQEDKKKWDVANPGEGWNFKEVKFNTNEGTWMNLDVSPDGKQIVFDMLGDIYTMPVSGGKAKVIRTGLPFEVQPRFSPDGTKISFTSDAGGGDNIWTMNADGSEAKQLTKENFRLLNNAVWTADGNYLIARKHFTSGRSLGAGEMWMYHKSGGGGIQLTTKKNDQQDVNEPTVSADGKYLYFCEDMYPGGSFQYNKDPNNQIYAIRRYEFATGELSEVTGGPGGSARPQISPKADHLAFIRRVGTKTVLFLRDLKTGIEWPIFDKLNKDQQEAWCLFGVYPNFAWLPDNENLIIWYGGKINKINTKTLEAANIPFEVEVDMKIADALDFKYKVHNERETAKVIRQAVTSPDDKMLVFHAIGYLWKKELPNGKPVRITSSKDFEYEPAFSADGKSIVYTTWNDEATGAINIINLDGSGAKKLNSEKGIFHSPSFSTDGSKIVFQRAPGNADQGFAFCEEPGIYWIPANGGKETLIIDEGSAPVFSADGKRIFFQSGGYFFGSLTKELMSADLSGNDKKTHVKSKYGNGFSVSPDNQWVAFVNLHQAYIAAMPPIGKTLDIDGSSTAVPVTKITRDAGLNLHWSGDSKNVHWTLGDEYFTVPLNERFAFMAGAPDSIPPLDTAGLKIGLEYKSDAASGRIAFKGAKIITMEGNEVIENGTIVINGNKIEAIGPAGKVTIPADAKVYDAKGKTIMPGMVDVHAHVGAFRAGQMPQKHWQFYTNLAYGVTTVHDPSALSETVFSLAELVKSGEMAGPRVYSTGIILYGAEGDFKAVINSLDDARSALRRSKAFGAHSVKSYNQPRREQRQQVIQAARELNMLVVPEGGSTSFHNFTQVIDGHTGIEHNIPIAPVYKDVTTMWGNSKTGYTPTLIVNYGGLNGENYFYQKSNVWEEKKLMNFYPHGMVNTRARHRTMAPDEEYKNGHILVSESCKKLADAGVKVNLGAHGQLQGLGAHWELWMLQQGGMTNLQALQAATINGAAYIGLEDEIGSLKVGKLADLIVLDKDPIKDIYNTNSVRYTMVNGRLYDTESMNEIGNRERKRGKFYWELMDKKAAFPWYGGSVNFQGSGCSCRH
jgi:imidazolonepropionase-like amidohydrolase/Tol biopolymer transport system component